MASNLEMELHCEICLDIYKNPVILPCSHSFCKDCLESWWKNKAVKDCPICKEKHHNIIPPSNLVLKNLCEAFLQQRKIEAATPLCRLHSEKLKLYCLDHEEPVCLICQASKAHYNHRFKPTNEAAEDYREELQKSLAPLREKVKQFGLHQAKWDKLDKHVQIQARRTEKQIKDQFTKLRQFLDKEEKARLDVLREEEKRKRTAINRKTQILSKEMQDLSDTIKVTEAELGAEDVSFLKQYKATVKKVQHCLQVGEPQNYSGVLINEAKHLGNLGYNIWNKMKDTVLYTPVILDPNSAGCRLVVSDNLMNVNHGKSTLDLPDNPERLSYYCVLGSEGFTNGSHSWEVEVKNNQNWTLGVATVSSQKNGASLSQIWRLCFCEGTYSAETKSGEYTFLSIKKQLQKIIVSLDIQTGRLYFFDVETNTHLCSFTDNFIGLKLYPYMFTEDGTPLKILPYKFDVTIRPPQS